MVVSIIVAIIAVPSTLLSAWYAVFYYNYVSKRCSEHHPYFSKQNHACLLCILLSAFAMVYCMQFLRRYGNSITLDTQLLIKFCAGIKLAHTANYKI